MNTVEKILMWAMIEIPLLFIIVLLGLMVLALGASLFQLVLRLRYLKSRKKLMQFIAKKTAEPPRSHST